MNLPSVAETGSAKLPASYIEAKKAIAQCVKLDECKDWSDKAMALASYARQAQDETLLKHAKRIIVRAIDRQGEILKSIPEGKTGPKPKDELGGGAPTQFPTRAEAAREAGLSKDQQIQAIRVNNVPRESFEAQVESDDPPSITELAEQGTAKRHVVEDTYSHSGFQEAIMLDRFLDRFANFPEIDYDNVKRGCDLAFIEDLSIKARSIAKWLDNVADSLLGIEER